MAKYRGNLDETLTLKSEYEVGFLWVKFEKKFIDQAAKTVRSDFHIQAYHPSEWDAMKKGCAKYHFDFVAACGYDDYEIIHNPSLVKTDADIANLLIAGS